MLGFIQLDSIAQTVTVDYGLCNNCGGTNPAYTQGTYQTRHIQSDYGMRAVPSGTVFHMGIDLLPDGGAAGDAIAAVDTGTVIDLVMPTGNAPKKIIIESNSSARRYAYLHTFKNQTPNQSLPIRSGAFVLGLTNNNRFAILNLVTGVAIATVAGDIMVYNNNNYPTTNTVVAGQFIAPIGTSGGKKPAGLPAHLHLSCLESGTNDRSVTESIDALNFVHMGDHPSNGFAQRIRKRDNVDFSKNICDENRGGNPWGTIIYHISYLLTMIILEM